MPPNHIRKESRPETPAQFYILVLEQDIEFAQTLKFNIEKRLPIEVATLNSLSIARMLLRESPEKFFLGITSVINLDSDAFEKIDLLEGIQYSCYRHRPSIKLFQA